MGGGVLVEGGWMSPGGYRGQKSRIGRVGDVLTLKDNCLSGWSETDEGSNFRG